jgi:hypothetical protein
VTGACPVCNRPHAHSLMCHHCTGTLERELHDVPAVTAELDTTLAKQSRLGPTGGGLAHERIGYHEGASLAADYLTNTLTTWARDLGHNVACIGEHAAVTAAAYLAHHIDDIRAHPAADELHDQLVDAVHQARREADAPANKTIIDVGPCPDCNGHVRAYIPTDDRPARMECDTDPAHRWDTTQWLRAGRRILDRIHQRKQGAA